MNTLKKFSVETHKGWASFQTWIKKWNKIMAVIFSALGIILLLSTVIVNALEVHEENQELLKNRNQSSRLNWFEVCHQNKSYACLLHCAAGTPTDISRELDFHWETNSNCQSNGMSIEISSSVQFPQFTVRADWLKGNFKLKELQIDLENIFVICEHAFATEVFKSMEKLVFLNLHLQIMDTNLLQKLFIEQHYEHLSIKTKPYVERFVGTKMDRYYDSILYMESEDKSESHSQPKLSDAIWLADITQPVIIGLTIIGCILSFSLGLLIRYNLFGQKLFLNKIDNANRMIFVVEKDASSLSYQSFNIQNERLDEK